MIRAIAKDFKGVGTRYLATPSEPFEWSADPKRAVDFHAPDDVIRHEGLIGAYVIEIEDGW